MPDSASSRTFCVENSTFQAVILVYGNQREYNIFIIIWEIYLFWKDCEAARQLHTEKANENYLRKSYHAGNVLRLVAEYLEKRYPDDMILDENMEITLSLKNGENGQPIVLGEEELQLSYHTADHSEDYYNHDVLTHLYTRCKYEHDLKVFQLANYARLTCIYMDAVGLHEINNHLGHEAGDHMLCSIADGIRKYFPDDCAYRIGGDEFVLLCPARQPEELAESLAAFCDTIREMGYEVSVGVSESTDRQTLNETVNQAETAMRHDKMEFYRNNGGIRQMRIIDDKLEQLLIKKQDVTRFLQAIAPLYRGVYMVNTKQDTCRYIYVPSYFKTMLENNHHAFMSSVREYCRELVHPEYHDEFAKLLDYSYIEKQIAAHGSLKMTYQIRGGSRVHLKITMADRSSADAHELLWIFLDETQ